MAAELGRAPTELEFRTRTGTSRHHMQRIFGRWSGAIHAAGLTPRLKIEPEDSTLLADWGRIVRKKRAIPSQRHYLHNGKHDPRTFELRFGGWSQVPEAFRRFAQDKPEWKAVLMMLRNDKAVDRHKELDDRSTYGNPMDFPCLRHEPVNEQGVVLLFGMLAHEIGYVVESVQMGFPDCEAKRRISPGRWQRVRIEFEYESQGFRRHRHPAAGCDVIVCWRHNWEECPKHLEVLELEKVIKARAA